jgi:hypothetical protein
MPGTFGPIATAPVAMTSWSNGSVALAARVVVLHGQLARVEVDRHDLVADAHVDAALAVLLRAADDEPLAVGEVLRDEVRDAARGVRRVRAALEGDDLEVRVAPQRLGRGAHARRVAADDRESLSHRAQRTLRLGHARAARGRDHRPPAGRGRARRRDRVDARARASTR